MPHPRIHTFFAQFPNLAVPAGTFEPKVFIKAPQKECSSEAPPEVVEE